MELHWDGGRKPFCRHWVHPKGFALLHGSCLQELQSYCLGVMCLCSFLNTSQAVCQPALCSMCFLIFLHSLLIPTHPTPPPPSLGIKLLTCLASPLTKTWKRERTDKRRRRNTTVIVHRWACPLHQLQWTTDILTSFLPYRCLS